ncbi:galectin-2 isoform X1 [Lagopus muta]|uniref:galectin-2 isoform X1 n=1 Tax=Lagopus muta TaxID=64668 RepID=UPI0020A0C2D4|nr:galectin-2 isoform X1 [Lagopus muta]
MRGTSAENSRCSTGWDTFSKQCGDRGRNGGWKSTDPFLFLPQGTFEMFNLDWKVGGTMKIKGHISEDADRFAINLGCKSSDLALHFNPRFKESVIVCNSLCSDNWQQEQRSKHFCFHKGSTVKIIIEFRGDKFVVKLPDGHEVEFPNRHGYDKISYLNIHGGFKVTSFKVE